MANNSREVLEKRVQNAIFREAIFRTESALIIALTLLLTVFGGLLIPAVPFWAWLIGGAVAEAIILYSSLTDPEFGRKVVNNMLHHEFRPERLRDRRLQQQINQALDYRSRINQSIRGQQDSILKDELIQTAGQIDDWLENIYDLARRIDRYRQELDILERDQHRAESRQQELQRELKGESDPAVRKQIESTLAGINRQLDTLNRLESTIQRAELQMENSLTHLGTIYSQTMLVDAKDIDSGRARRLRQEIDEEVVELNDVLLAMDEVYSAEQSA